MTAAPRRIIPWWRIAIVLLVVWAVTFGWKLSGDLPPEQQRTGLGILLAGMLGLLLVEWVVKGFRRREPE
jgi:hypothetical protein